MSVPPTTEAPAVPQRPRIEDVAAAAGVSTATVSRVLNGQAVREPLRQRVRAAVAELGYVPHAGARALMLHRTGTVGAIFPTVDNAIFAQAIDALQRRLGEDGLQLLIATSGYSTEHEMRQAVNLVARGVDALALCGVSQRPELLAFLRQRGTPCVHVMSVPGPADAVCVGFDNGAAIGQAVRYLLDLGHRRIGMLAGITRDNDRATARVAGARAVLAAAGLTLAPPWLVERPYTLDAAREGLRELMAAPTPPTAVLCGNDVLAFGALLEAQHLGIEVPSSLSIVGFDDLELARHLHPAITTVRVPAEAMWRLAGDRLVAALRGAPVPRCTPVEVSLVVRGSTAPPPSTRQRGARAHRAPGRP
jgi:LacI family transcriptional regulator